MQIVIDPELREYMTAKNRRNLVLDVATANTSDFEISEIYLRYATDKMCEHLIRTKGFRSVPSELGQVLLPAYHLHYKETLRFYFKKGWIFRHLSVEGVEL